MSAPIRRPSRPVPAWMAEAPRSRRPSRKRVAVLLTILVIALAVAAIATDTLRAGWAFSRVLAHVSLFINPPPDRDTAVTVASTPQPRGGSGVSGPTGSPGASDASPGPTATSAGPTATDAGASPTPAAEPSGSQPAASGPVSSPAPTAPAPTVRPTPTPLPIRAPVQVSIVKDAAAVFAHELTDKWCAVAATQTVLAILGKGDTSDAFQKEIAGRIGEWESRKDSHDGGWGPAAIVLALKAYGVTGYEVRAYATRTDALVDAALAIDETQKPVLLLTWRGAHTWVMTGYKADANPEAFADAQITHAQILDPWYPFVSSIWGASHRPGFFHTLAEMVDNYLPWQRPEGAYADRDGMFIAVVPTTPR